MALRDRLWLQASLGRIVILDQGWYPIGLRFMLKIVDVPFITEVITRIAHTLPDYQRNNHERAHAISTPQLDCQGCL